MISSRLIKSNNAAAGCVDIVDAYDPFDGNGVALYQLNGNANDVSGNYNGTATNVTYGTGVFGQAGVFNGSSSKIDISSISNSSLYSVSMWIKPSFSEAYGTYFMNGSAVSAEGSTAFNLRNNNTNSNFQIKIGANSSSYFSENFTENEWVHIVLTTNKTDTSKVYINGEDVHSFTSDFDFNVNERKLIGCSSSVANGDSIHSAGSIDQVRIFDTVLTPLEVEALYTEELCICGGTVDTLDILDDSSCIATYQLDGNANDLSGNYSGTPTDVSYGVGEFDLAGVFNGSTSYITLPVTQSNDISISAWIKIEDLTRQHQIVSYDTGGASSDRCLQFRVEFDQTVSAYWFSGTKAQSTSSVSQGVWAHVVATWEDNGTQKIYFNGAMEDSNAATTRPNFPNLYAGKRSISGTTVDDFLGSIDQVRIFNKALNSTEVTTLYNETACTPAACTSGTTNTLDILGDGSCIATYTLDGTPADLSGNYNGVQTDVTYPQGYFDLAGSFNGSSSEITNSGTVNVDLDFSVSLWFNNQGAGVHPAQCLWNGENRDNSLQFNFTNNTVTFFLYDGTVRDVLTSTVPSGWNNVVVTRSKTSGLEIYLNGTSQDTNSFTGNASSLTAVETIGNLGRAGVDRFFNGSIDQVRIFNKALSASEVTTLYNETPCN